MKKQKKLELETMINEMELEVVEGQGCNNDCEVEYWVGNKSVYKKGCYLKKGKGPASTTWW